MIKHKLKIGDNVIVLDPIDRISYGPGWASKMEDYIGQKATVFDVSEHANDRYRLKFDDGNSYFWWDVSNLQIVEPDLLY